MKLNIFSTSIKNFDIKTEISAGVTTFLTMAYIIFVNPSVLQETGMDPNALIVATCLISAFACILMGIVANAPIALAPGMGLNAFFAFTLVLGMGVSWQIALGMVFIAGFLFFLLGIFGLREKIVEAIPSSLVAGIAVGIGLFLLFIGFKNLGLIVANPNTLVALGSFSPEVLIGLGTLFLTIILLVRKVPGAILIGIIAATLVALFLGKTQAPAEIFSLKTDLSPLFLQLDILGALQLSLIGPIFSLLFIDLFDTVGTLVACSHEAKLVQKDGKIKNLRKMLHVDAIATMASGLIGSSPTTSYVESASGIAAGGRTGLTSVVTGLLFLLGLLFVPLIGMVPAYATAPALIIVGMMMVKQIMRIDFSDFAESFPAILTFTMMVFSFKIAVGLAVGFLSWGIIRIGLFRFKDISITMWIIMAVSLLSLIVK